MWQIAEGIRGMGEACRALNVPIVSGNASLYNETKGSAVLPTPMVATVGLIDDASKAVSSNFNNSGDLVFLIGDTFEDLGGTEYMAQYAGVEKGRLPVLDYELELRTARLIRNLINDRLLSSCHDLSQGGLAMGLVDACMSRYGSIGAEISPTKPVIEWNGAETKRRDSLLFAETGARYLVSLDPKNESAVRKLAHDYGLSVSAEGRVGGDKISIQGYAQLSLSQVENAWRSGLNSLI